MSKKLRGKDALGDCFEIAARKLMAMAMAMPEDLSVELVHGLVTGSEGTPVEARRFTHGWLELGTKGEVERVVLDFSNGRSLAIPAKLYYLIGDIREEETVRYTPLSMRQRVRTFKHFGPWEGAPAAHRDPYRKDVGVLHKAADVGGGPVPEAEAGRAGMLGL